MRIHWSTLLLPFGVLLFAYFRELGNAGLLWLFLFVLATIVCVLLHELGHAFVARVFKIPVHDIILLPIGGAARLERLPEQAWKEAVIAFAGPLVNLLIALALLPSVFLWPEYEWYPWLSNYTVRSGIVSLAFFNAAIFAFNLLPIFPLDGGRLLRAALSHTVDRLAATRITSFVARLFALAGFTYSLYIGSFFLGGFCIYVFLVAGREIRMAKVQAFFDRHTVGEIAEGLRVFDPHAQVEDVLHQLKRNNQHGAVVADDCCPIGFVTQEMLRLAEPDQLVSSLDMQMVVCHDSLTSLRVLRRQFAEHPESVAIEEIDTRPVGYITLSDFERAFQAFAKTA